MFFLLQQHLIVENRIETEMVDKVFHLLRCVPGSAKEPIDVCSQHRASVIQAEEGIKRYFLELPLPHESLTDISSCRKCFRYIWKRLLCFCVEDSFCVYIAAEARVESWKSESRSAAWCRACTRCATEETFGAWLSGYRLPRSRPPEKALRRAQLWR